MLANYLKKQSLNHDAVNLFVHHFFRSVGAGMIGMFGDVKIVMVASLFLRKL